MASEALLPAGADDRVAAAADREAAAGGGEALEVGEVEREGVADAGATLYYLTSDNPLEDVT